MEGRGRGVCLLGKFLNRSSVNAVQLVLLLTIQKEHLMSFRLQVGQWESLLLSLELKKERAIVINFYPDINWEEVTCKHVEDSVCQSWLEWRESECEQHESFWHLRNVSQYRAKLVPWSVFCLFCSWGWLLGFFVHFVLGGFFGSLGLVFCLFVLFCLLGVLWAFFGWFVLVFQSLAVAQLSKSWIMVKVSVVEGWFWNPSSVPLYLILFLKNLQPCTFPSNSYVRIFWEYVFAFGLTEWSYLISLASTELNWKCSYISSIFCLSLVWSNLILIENFTFLLL